MKRFSGPDPLLKPAVNNPLTSVCFLNFCGAPPFASALRAFHNRWNRVVCAHHQDCVTRLTDTCGCQEEKCASPNASRGGITDRAGKEVCKWSNGGWNPACRSAHTGPRASLRMRRGLRSCPPQRVVGSPLMVTCPDSRVMRSCMAHGSTPPSVFRDGSQSLSAFVARRLANTAVRSSM